MSDHVAADLLELYVLGRVTEPQLGRIEEHLLLCEQCRQHLEETEKYVTSIRWGLRSIGSTVAIHATASGDVYLFTRKQGSQWLARVIGEKLDVGKICETEGEAEQRCRETFADLFPEHRCTAACRVA